jgi:hypothetical protein
MSPITVTWPGEAAPGTFTFQITKAALDAILNSTALQTCFGSQSQNATQDPFTETGYASGLANNPALSPEPNLIKAIMDAALAGGGLTGNDSFGVPVSTDAAQRLYFSKPLLARSTVATIVAAAIAAG